MKRLLVLVAVALLVSAVGTSAAPISGSSTGTLALGSTSSDLGRSSAKGPQWIEWGHDNHVEVCGVVCANWVPTWDTGSVLQAYTTNFNVTGAQDDVVLGYLRWANRTTLPGVTHEWLDVTWDLAFAVPGTEASPPISMRINNTMDPLSLFDADRTQFDVGSLDDFAFKIDGWIISGFAFRVMGSGGFFSPHDNTWSNFERSESYLAVTADFTPVPEPASMLLLGSGLIGLAARGRRRT